MYRKRRRRSSYNQQGGQVIAWYTDRYGRRRPVTRRKGRQYPQRLLLRLDLPTVPIPSAENVVTRVLSRVPIAREIYAAYVLADSLCGNWDAIAQLYDTYRQKGVQGVADKLGTNAVHNALSSIQTDAVWAMVCGNVPQPYQSTAKGLLGTVMSTITTAEIALARQVLGG
jgi:hypothetical protein